MNENGKEQKVIIEKRDPFQNILRIIKVLTIGEAVEDSSMQKTKSSHAPLKGSIKEIFIVCSWREKIQQNFGGVSFQWAQYLPLYHFSHYM